MKTEVNTKEEYDALLKHGIDALCDDRYHLEIGLRIAIQKEKFGRNDDVGNAKFYHYCLTHFPMVCENCGKPIRHPWATNVSHILTRGAHPTTVAILISCVQNVILLGNTLPRDTN